MFAIHSYEALTSDKREPRAMKKRFILPAISIWHSLRSMKHKINVNTALKTHDLFIYYTLRMQRKYLPITREHMDLLLAELRRVCKYLWTVENARKGRRRAYRSVDLRSVPQSKYYTATTTSAIRFHVRRSLDTVAGPWPNQAHN